MPANAPAATPILFSLDQIERATQPSVGSLLPIDLYEALADKIGDAIPTRRESGPMLADEFHRLRRHAATLIQGGRGTGKSTVLVNLPRFLEERRPALASDVHVLKPVDPSQLEDNEDLFLNVIVAAVLSDETLTRAQERNDAKRRVLYERLQDLGQSLEDRQVKRENAGIDSLRAFMGSHHLAVAVHAFFDAALDVLGKRLLVLPLDDVDTTLHRAFENLEVVRRYLSSPLVLPVICGDLDLYHELIRRDFLHGLTKDSVTDWRESSVATASRFASELAVEYERKLLPVQNRLEMPSFQTYLASDNILLASDGVAAPGALSVRGLAEWIRALLMGPVNGLENSELVLPVRTVRALSQLVGRVRELVPQLAGALSAPGVNSTPLGIRRALQMPEVTPEAMRAFEATQVGSRGDGGASKPVYTTFLEALAGKSLPGLSDVPLIDLARAWREPLLQHFRFEPTAAQACLVLLAEEYWSSTRPSQPHATSPSAGPATLQSGDESVLATPLFAPHLQLRHPMLSAFEREVELPRWRTSLESRLPQDALDRLPERALVAFAEPEVGRAIAASSTLRFSDALDADRALRSHGNLLIDLLLHHDYYSDSKRAPLILSGRILELLVTSLVRDVQVGDLTRILISAPFHSAPALAPTKALSVGGDEDDAGVDAFADRASHDRLLRHLSIQQLAERDDAMNDLVREINAWRERSGIHRIDVSPWLVYNTLNKTLNQAWYFNPPMRVGHSPKPGTPFQIASTGWAAFNSFWAAVGSFEKGALFGLPRVVSTVNVLAGANFESSDAYRLNIAPFFQAEQEGRASFGLLARSVTFALGDHPLRKWFGEVRSVPLGQVLALDHNEKPDPEIGGSTSARAFRHEQELQARSWLRRVLNGGDSSQLGLGQLTRLLNKGVRSRRDMEQISRALRQQFPTAVETHQRLEQALAAARFN